MSKEQIIEKIKKYLVNTNEESPIILKDIIMKKGMKDIKYAEGLAIISIFYAEVPEKVYFRIQYDDILPLEIEHLYKEDMQKILDYLDNYYNY